MKRLWLDVKHIIYKVQIIVVVWRIVMAWICKGVNPKNLFYRLYRECFLYLCNYNIINHKSCTSKNTTYYPPTE